MTTTVLGFKISMPIMVAPTAMQKMAHPEGKKSKTEHSKRQSMMVSDLCFYCNVQASMLPLELHPQLELSWFVSEHFFFGQLAI